MTSHRRVHGAAPLLFERLTAPQDGTGAAPGLHDWDALRASVARELHDLFNTRAALSAGRLEGRTRSAVDYGMPDLSAFPLGEHAATARLAADMRTAIVTYEPRLHEPAVQGVVADPARAGALIATVTGILRMGLRAMPVRFELPLGRRPADAV